MLTDAVCTWIDFQSVVLAIDGRKPHFEPGFSIVTGWNAEGYQGVLTQYVESRLPRWIRRYLGVSDVVQSVFFAASRSTDKFRGTTDAEYRGWLIRIAERKIIDSLRRYQLREGADPKRILLSARSPGQVDAATPDECVSSSELARALLESIDTLPAEVKSVVISRYAGDMTFAEIASQLDMPESTCQRRWLEGIKLLAARLNGFQP